MPTYLSRRKVSEEKWLHFVLRELHLYSNLSKSRTILPGTWAGVEAAFPNIHITSMSKWKHEVDISACYFPCCCIHNLACLTRVRTWWYHICHNTYKYFSGWEISRPQLSCSTLCLDITYEAYRQFLPQEFKKEVGKGGSKENWGTESSSNMLAVVQQACRNWRIKARPSKAQFSALTARPSPLKILLHFSIAQKIGALNSILGTRHWYWWIT